MLRWLLPILFFASATGAAEPELKSRKPWNTSKISGSPEPPPPYMAARAFPDAKFDKPLVIARQGETLFIGEQGGKIFALKAGKPVLFADLKEQKSLKTTPDSDGFENLYGLVFHPKFAENRTVFVCYTLKPKKGIKNLTDGTRVSRFQVKNHTLDIDSEEIVITYLQGGHNGGDLHFGPDGFLYISTGDSADPNPPDSHKTGQDVSDFLASILRIDVDRKDDGKNYAIPKDNPFVGQSHLGKPIRPEIWSYGFRNPWRMSFDRVTGDLWVGDVGWETYEMVHRLEKGSNHGWSVVEGRQPINDFKVGPTPIRPPVIELDHSQGASVTGGFVYRGRKFPELFGKYVFGDWETRRIWAATIKDDRMLKLEELTTPVVRVVAFGEDATGELYFLDHDTGLVHTLEKNTSPEYDPKKFPRKLSETGLFEDTKTLKLAEGVQPFSVNVPMWNDGGVGERFIALPGDSKVKDFDEKKSLPGNVEWHKYKLHFPKNAVLGKTISLKLDDKTTKRIETQILHFDGVNWAGYTYAWNDAQTDAELMPLDGDEKLFVVADKRVPGGKREQMWQFHSRSQCVQCHNAWAEVSLAFNLEQLNMKAFGRNQYAALCEIGLIERIGKDGKVKGKLEEKDAEKMKKFTPLPPDVGFIIKEKKNELARSYLHVNCAHCHRFGGGGAVNFELTFDSDLKKLIDVPPTRGDFGNKKVKLIAKDSPSDSVLMYRMAKFGKDRMPHIGSEMVDSNGVMLVYQWIFDNRDGSGVYWRANIPVQLDTLNSALAEAILIGQGLSSEDRGEDNLKQAIKLPYGPIRDLFSGYFPPDGKPRKLGPNPKPRSILNLKGDAERGKAIFLSERMQCVNCHKHENKGNEIGPDLSKIGKERSREEMLESLLDPSRRVEPKFQSYILKTIDGQAITGLMVSKDTKQVVLKDALNKLHTIPLADVELLQPSRQSLMPSGLLGDLTPQEAADLLEWLSNRK